MYEDTRAKAPIKNITFKIQIKFKSTKVSGLKPLYKNTYNYKPHPNQRRFQGAAPIKKTPTNTNRIRIYEDVRALPLFSKSFINLLLTYNFMLMADGFFMNRF